MGFTVAPSTTAGASLVTDARTAVAVDSLLQPELLLTRDEANSRFTGLPKAPGIYAWYFDEAPPKVPTDGVHRLNGMFLLYAGISPKKPRQSDGKTSGGTLRSRIRSHYKGNASQSTLRLTLGSLLNEVLDIRLQQTGSGRLNFGEGEIRLSAWMSEHSRVCWVEHDEPWLVESAFIASVPLRLNLDQNKNSDFHAHLTQARSEQRARARQKVDRI
jgi:hypothetical protein